MRLNRRAKALALVALALATTAMLGLSGCSSGSTSNTSLETAPVITTTAPSAMLVVGESFSYTIEISGFPKPVVSVAGGPAWLTLAGSVLSGAPSAGDVGGAGTLVVTASNGVAPDATQSIAWAALAGLSITTTSLDDATEGRSFTRSLAATGGQAPYSWATANTLPQGWALSANGRITAASASVLAGSCQFDAEVTDNAGRTASSTVTLTVNPPPDLSALVQLPPVTEGTPYSHTLAVNGGTPPYTWSAVSGLPANWSLAQDGLIAAAPTDVIQGTYNGLTVSVTDANGAVATGATGLVVNPPVNLVTSALLPGTEGAGYSATLLATDGTPAYTWTSTNLPAGFSLAPGSGVLTASGLDKLLSPYSFDVTVTDSCGSSDSVTLSMVVREEGEVMWAFAAPNIFYSSPAIAADGTIYAGSSDNVLYAVNPDGTQKWMYTTAYFITSSPAVANDGTVYIGSADKFLYAINPDGSLKWSYQTAGFLLSCPTLASDGTIYIGATNNKIYALNPDGTLKWTFDTNGPVISAPSIASDGSIYFGSQDFSVYALEADGSLRWSHATGDIVKSSAAIGADGTVYIGSEDFNVYAFDPVDGSVKWAYATGGKVDSSPAIAADGTIYIGSGDKRLHAINPDGTARWSFLTGDVVWSSPAVAQDGTVLVGSHDFLMYAINTDGTLRWSFTTGEKVRSSPAVGPDGTVYVGSNDKSLYAFHAASGPLAQAAWPKFRHDNRGVGRRP